MAIDTDILVVGAGPIGLINAWGMKRLNPNLKIVILEKYSEYQRSHTLVMQAAQLEAIMKATNSEQDPTLVELLEQLKSDPHIRTNALQQIFTKLAKDSGIEVHTEQEVTDNNIQQKLTEEFPNVRLIIGADGTHSVVSNALFSEHNQVKYDFDYVLQLRYEIKGEAKSSHIKTLPFLQQMARKGLIANEYVGHFEDGKTPVTMQMMISKEDFLKLQKATSKNPIKPFSESKPEQTQSDIPEIPKQLKSFLTSYIRNKILDTSSEYQLIDQESIRISVNEAPATHAKQVVTTHGQAHVLLEGDAALGLSYFKGLNAGLEASARFLSIMAPAIKASFKNSEVTDKLLNEYQNWFLYDYAPKKVKEVGNYSFWQIRSFMNAMQVVRRIKNASSIDFDDDLSPAIRDYFNHFSRNPLTELSDSKGRLFPHREYDLIEFGELSYVPLKHTAKKIGKIFVDYIKPYKSNHQIKQDFKQPLVGIANLFIGLGKTLVGIFTGNLKSLSDGLLNVIRGVIEIVTTPLNCFLKPMTRGFATLIHGGYKKIEENSGLSHLAHYGKKYLERIDESQLKDKKTIYELLAVCNDMHRKFDKSSGRGQKTKLALDEYQAYAAIRSDTTLDKQKLVDYFSLFAPEKSELVAQVNNGQLHDFETHTTFK
ncbi:FAD-dependent oxidoreductase [Legionella waltersii]|uniref:Kynurenine 3-monooxygenase n=1 Tax=Legionella waltersii TaxID=66969 RepID=A0A0W1A4T3_9GAMM|nr:FAD-dependent monooxygenase [Legionella waltersii]KTD76326.1 Kynurenine 3-monooxygenase [Legionella waltersii]SNV13740.1 Uncharacterised protein [Legionella waltersii]